MRRRLLLSHLALVIGLLVLLEVPLAIVYSRYEHDALDATLRRDAAAVATYIESSRPSDVAAFARALAQPGELIIAIDAEGHELTSTGLLSHDAAFLSELQAARHDVVIGEQDDLVYDAVPTAGGGSVLVARGDEVIDAKVHRAWWALAGIGAALLALGALISTRVSARLVAPVSRLRQTAGALGDGDLTARADERVGPPEITALSRTLNRMAEQLGDLVSSQRRFVADASHQLRTPLTALRLRVEAWPTDEAPSADDREAALAELGRLTRIVDGLLALARAEGNRPARAPVDVAAAARERHGVWEPLADERGISLRVDAVGQLRALLVDGHVEQILDNLVDNAIVSCGPGDEILLSACRSNGRVEIHVVDSGRGMSGPERAHAFDPFWRGHDERGTGTGLGLTIVEQLVRSSGGAITLDQSEKGGVDATMSFDAA